VPRLHGFTGWWRVWLEKKFHLIGPGQLFVCSISLLSIPSAVTDRALRQRYYLYTDELCASFKEDCTLRLSSRSASPSEVSMFWPSLIRPIDVCTSCDKDSVACACRIVYL
jgi:hypothetical protein